MPTTILGVVITDHTAFLIHVYLLAGDVLATIAVGVGIVWEHGPPDVQKVASRLVILGVVAETLCSIALFSFDETISDAEQSKIITLEKSNDFLLAQGQEVEAFASRARRDAAKATERAAELEKEAAEAKERVVKAELEVAKMKTPRKIDDSQYAILVACLRESPKGPVYVRPGFLDRDARELGDRIKSALKDADFPDPPPWQSANDALSWNTPGIFLIVRDLKNPPPGAASLQQCFAKAGIEAFGYTNDKEPDGTTSIGIGPRF